MAVRAPTSSFASGSVASTSASLRVRSCTASRRIVNSRWKSGARKEAVDDDLSGVCSGSPEPPFMNQGYLRPPTHSASQTAHGERSWDCSR